MASDAVYEKLTNILRDVFDDESLSATPELTANKVDGWDSFGHLRLIFAVEKSFGVNFASSEISSLKNLGELADLIGAKIPA